MDRSLGLSSGNAAEARALIGAARAFLAELVEEGVDRIERDAEAPAETAAETKAPETKAPETKPRAAEPAPPRPVPTRVGAGGDAALPGLDEAEAPPWGDAPSLDAVQAHLGECTRCGLCNGRNRIVFGDGNPQAELMFVGEGPGADEDRQGLPFVGRAGELLTKMIEAGLEIPRPSVYICNIVKCRPPGNRTPLPDEVATCRPFLDGQIDAIRPRVIVALGKPAASLLLGRDVAITRVRGTWQEYRVIPVMPTFHPAFILRQYTPENRRLVWEDLKAALTRARGQD